MEATDLRINNDITDNYNDRDFINPFNNDENGLWNDVSDDNKMTDITNIFNNTKQEEASESLDGEETINNRKALNEQEKRQFEKFERFYQKVKSHSDQDTNTITFTNLN